MAYTSLNKKDGDVFSASDVSHIEAGITQNESDISEVKDSLSTLNLLQASAEFSSIGELISYIAGNMKTRSACVFYGSSELAGEMTDGDASLACRGFLFASSLYQIEFLMSTRDNLYFGRINRSSGTNTYRKVALT